MPVWTLVVIAIGLSADAFAVAIGKGLQLRRIDVRTTVAVAVTFGGFQALMPLLGWLAGTQFAEAVADYDHWIAFGLLFLVGAKMIHEALSADPEESPTDRLGVRELLVLGIATSIDALAAGVSFSMLQINIWWAIVLIGVITAAVSALGLHLGRTVGKRFRKPAEIIGGLILIAIGVNVLIQHLSA